MNELIKKIKVKLSRIDFRKIYDHFPKMNFYIYYENKYYDGRNIFSKESFSKILLRKTTRDYVILTLDNKNVNRDDIIIELVNKMFNQYLLSLNKQPLTHLNYDIVFKEETIDIFKLRYQFFSNLLNNLKTETKTIYFDEEKCLDIEYFKEVGLKSYIELRTYKQLNKQVYDNKINELIKTISNPFIIFEPFRYQTQIGVSINLICSFKRKQTDNQQVSEDININFLYENYLASTRRLMMNKMIRAKKLKIDGYFVKTNLSKMIKNEHLYYISNFFQFERNHKIYQKDGEFILKINQSSFIEEAYECISLEKYG